MKLYYFNLFRLFERTVMIPFKENSQFTNYLDSCQFKEDITEFIGVAEALLPALMSIDYQYVTFKKM